MRNNKNVGLVMKFFLITVCLIFPSIIFADTDSALEAQIAGFMKADVNQGRSSLTYNSILARVAREKAYDMARRGYFAHVNPDGIGPNYLVSIAGYRLPDHYDKAKSGGNIESCAAGNETAADTWIQWMNSPLHRKHILGLDTFFALQTQYGIGHAYVQNSQYKHYWVIITAPPEEHSNFNFFDFNSTVNQNTTSFSESTCTGTSTNFSNVVKKANGKLSPVCGYVWASSDLNDYRVKLMPGLIRTSDGNLRPADGYTWMSKDPKDFRVKLKIFNQ